MKHIAYIDEVPIGLKLVICSDGEYVLQIGGNKKALKYIIIILNDYICVSEEPVPKMVQKNKIRFSIPIAGTAAYFKLIDDLQRDNIIVVEVAKHGRLMI